MCIRDRFVIEPMKLGEADKKVLSLLPKDKPVLLVVNKSDLMGDKGNLLPLIQDFDLLHDFCLLYTSRCV